MKNIIGVILFFNIFSLGCSTVSNPTLLTGVSSFFGCSLIGIATAPEDESAEMHGLLWGSSCAAAGMAISELVQTRKEKKQKNQNLTQYRSDDTLQELRIKNSLLNSDGFEALDSVTKGKIKGNWSVYKTDNWIMDRGKIKHEDLEIQF